MPFRTNSPLRICWEHDVRSSQSCFPGLKLFGYPGLRATGQENDRRGLMALIHVPSKVRANDSDEAV